MPQPPCVDANAPDLYLPLMSFVTYMLVAGFVSGADGRFTPEVLASSGSFGLFMVIFEVCLIKLMLYLLNATGQAGLADLAVCAPRRANHPRRAWTPSRRLGAPVARVFRWLCLRSARLLLDPRGMYVLYVYVCVCVCARVCVRVWWLSLGGAGRGLASCAQATAGYKFFFAVVVVLSYAFGGRAAGYVAIGLGGANMGTFFWHTLQQCMIEPGGVALGFMHEAGSPSKTEKKKKQTYSLLVIALLQPLWFWWLLARV